MKKLIALLVLLGCAPVNDAIRVRREAGWRVYDCTGNFIFMTQEQADFCKSQGDAYCLAHGQPKTCWADDAWRIRQDKKWQKFSY